MTMQQAQQSLQSAQVLFAFGLGYSAQGLAKRLKAKGWRIGGTVRGAEKAQTLRADGIEAHVFDALNGADIPEGSHWLISVPPEETGCPVFRAFGKEAPRAASITYLSTTGVYGDLGGGWAFEWTRVAPGSHRAKRRVLAEDQWTSTRRPCRLVRLPGIYGPGRSPFSRVHAGTAKRIIKHGQVFSRVHVDDIVSGLDAMMNRLEAQGVFHLCDDKPAKPQDVITFAAELLGMDLPDAVDFDRAELSDMARSFYAECKRVSNARAKSALGWRPQYPTYKEGLRAVIAAEQATTGAKT
jgi:nucleoside-diphosphate-sugar epimerase